MVFEKVTENKKQYLDLLLLADEQESMVDRYLKKGEMFLVRDPDVVGECVVCDMGGGTFEIKNLATAVHGKGYGRALIEHVLIYYRERCKLMLVGTGDSPLTLPFYEKCGFREHHRIKNFFTDHYDHPIIEAGILLRDMVVLARKPQEAQTMKAIVNTKLVMEDGIIWDGALLMDGDRIAAVGDAADVSIPAGAQIIDAGGLYTAPGLIDIHNHGSEKNLFANEPYQCAEHFLRHGQTTVLPTLYCDLTAEQMICGAEKIKEAAMRGAGRIMDGLYMEGPYMNGEGSNQKYIRWGGKIRREDYAELLKKLASYARVWAIDPSREGIAQFMKDVREANPKAIFALGHSEATAADCRKAKKLGATLQTHHGDSGKAPGAAQGTIGAGCDEFTLYDPDIFAELICDQVGIHIDADMIKMLIRTKGVERIILITDSMAAAGDYKNNEAEGIAYGPDLNYDYEGHLAGSHLTLDCACRNVMKHTGYGLCHAIRFATANPARMLGIDDEVGTLEAGKKANVILIDDMVNVKTVFLEGEKAVQDGEVLL